MKNTKYTKDYCQSIVDKAKTGYTVIDVVYGKKTTEHYCIIQCDASAHKTKKVRCFHLCSYKFQCSECVLDKKINDIKAFLNDSEYEFIAFDSNNKSNRHIVHIRDANYSYVIEWANLRKGGKPLLVSSSNPYSTKNMISYINNETRYRYIGGNYINADSPIICHCELCNENFDTSWESISANRGCPYCRGLKVCDKNSFIKNYPELAVEIDFEKTAVDVNSITIGSGKTIWFRCSKCNESYQSDARSRRGGHGCPQCGIQSRSGENSPRWNGGISDICEYLRRSIDAWRFNTINFYGGKCVISGEIHDRVVHHLNAPYIEIVNECFSELEINVRKTIGEYTRDEMESLQDLCLRKHYEYGLGVVLNKCIHNEFHAMFGYKDNTRDQFIEFAKSKGVCDIQSIIALGSTKHSSICLTSSTCLM